MNGFGPRNLYTFTLISITGRRSSFSNNKGCEWCGDRDPFPALCSNWSLKAKSMKKNQGFANEYHLQRGLAHLPSSTNSKEKANDPAWQQPPGPSVVVVVSEMEIPKIPFDAPWVGSFHFAEDFMLQALIISLCEIFFGVVNISLEKCINQKSNTNT